MNSIINSSFIKSVFYLIFFVISFCFFSNCQKKEVIVYHTVEKIVSSERRNQSNAKQENTKIKPNSNQKKVSWKAPKNWIEGTAGNMQIGKFLFDKATSDHVSIATFPGDVGGDLANINRWRRQLSIPATTKDKIKFKKYKSKNKTFEVVSINNQSDSIIVAIFKEKDQTTFVKMMAKSNIAKKRYSEFIDFCLTIKIKN